MATVKVWDPFVRVFHWSLVASFAVAFLVSEERDLRTLHLWAGYAAAALVTLRIVWGLLGTRYARFSQFVHGPRRVLGYAVEVARGQEARHIGHNPAGGAMVVALLLAMLGLSLTGYLMTTDQFWGSEPMEEAHELLANGMLVLVALHIAGVVLESVRHRESLIKAMVTGRKRAPGEGDIA
ncbi:MAG: cytochrome b/b6 domain-containing protein [Hyphomicrobiaceae bacterium]